MLITFVSKPSSRKNAFFGDLSLYRRKGGGKGGGGGGRSSGGTTPGRGSTTVSSGTTKFKATPYGSGGGHPSTVPPGSLFAGRKQGGGKRDQVYGTITYGSGYPDGDQSPGVKGKGFPFYFWPVVWTNVFVPYLDGSEYGTFANTARPGGPLATALFHSRYTSSVFRITSDNETVFTVFQSIHWDTTCSSRLSFSDRLVFNDTASQLPQPAQAIQYYRASSVVLTLDDYNNSAAMIGYPHVLHAPIPATADMILLDCLNRTTGESLILVNAAPGRFASPEFSLVMSLMIAIYLLRSLV
ncbi:hypothetical protein B0H34DRAFT_799139 [Crassisporium funariophilum]|nr:hypothetical protein B0H34DRAFT_799139 [Crassisporium funariophilum]